VWMGGMVSPCGFDFIPLWLVVVVCVLECIVVNILKHTQKQRSGQCSVESRTDRMHRSPRRLWQGNWLSSQGENHLCAHFLQAPVDWMVLPTWGRVFPILSTQTPMLTSLETPTGLSQTKCFAAC
jgi:hypothetical protein